MIPDVFELARHEAMNLGQQYDHRRSLEDVLVGELASPLRAEIARLRLQGRMREYVDVPAAYMDDVFTQRWQELEEAFTYGKVVH